MVDVSKEAQAAGVTTGLSLAEARAVLPSLKVTEVDPNSDRHMLEALADWCRRYTPWTAVDENSGYAGVSGSGLWLDISGCAHLFGGEQALLNDLTQRLSASGFVVTAAVADTPGAAWAVARFVTDKVGVTVPPGEARTALAPLPIAALRIPADVIEGLNRVGLLRIGNILQLPRAPLAVRFGNVLLGRVDQALGRTQEPLSPRHHLPAMHTRLSFAEPIGQRDDIAFATSQLIADLCVRLEAAHLGARHLELALYRTDAMVVRVNVGTSQAVRDPAHLERLFREKLQNLDAGFGVEVITLAAVTIAPLASIQPSMGFGQDLQKEKNTAKLVDRFCNRLGNTNVVHLTEHASHIPELACREVPALTGEHTPRTRHAAMTDDSERSRQPRPLKLLPSPEPIEVIAPVPDGPPAAFRWHRIQHRLIAAEGPERIGPEWWLDGTYGHDPEHSSRIRDYYRVENSKGHRFWIYREGLYRPGISPHWYLHGVFP